MSDKNTVKIALIGCLGLLVAGGCIGTAAVIGIIATRPSDAESQGPTAYVQAFFSDIREGNRQDAFHRMSHGYQATHSLDAFGERLDALETLSAHEADEPVGEAGTDSRFTVTGTLSSGAEEVPFQVVTEKTGLYWYLESVKVGDETL